jgi:hypothetical protein
VNNKGKGFDVIESFLKDELRVESDQEFRTPQNYRQTKGAITIK